MVLYIATIIFFGSLIGLGSLLFLKVPKLLELQENSVSKFNLNKSYTDFKTKIKAVNPLKNISGDLVVHKTLSKIRVLALKTEHGIAKRLESLRKKSQKEKIVKEDNYWNDLNKSINKEKTEK